VEGGIAMNSWFQTGGKEKSEQILSSTNVSEYHAGIIVGGRGPHWTSYERKA